MPFLSDSVVTGSNVLLFGSHALSFTRYTADNLRSKLLQDTKHRWIQDVISGLPSLWEDFSSASPRWQHFRAKDLLVDLDTWLQTGQFASTSFPLPNTLLTPFVVISQLIEYSNLVEKASSEPTSQGDTVGPFWKNAETLGLCTGILAGIAASCSRSQADIEKHGAVAVRLAVLIGAITDAQDTKDVPERRVTSFSVAWSTSRSGFSLDKVLSPFPEAYVSVKVDETRATVTAPRAIAKDLHQHLTAAGFVIGGVDLRGRFHNRCHSEDLDLLVGFCDTNSKLQFSSISDLATPARTDIRGERIQEKDGPLHQVAARCMLTEQADWHTTFDTLSSSVLNDSTSRLVCIGPESYVPRAIAQQLGTRVVQANSMHRKCIAMPENGVAVIGMSCKVPGADDLEEFWKLLCEAKSQHISVPEERFGFETSWRDLNNRKWFGNFLRDYDSFDHKFFQKSPREMAASDPQHRLMLQVAYQAVEQSGYFNRPQKNKHIGCYIGVANADYERNVACHPANAYSATGNLKSFTSGKINHYFGWTGPSMTIDTACSASIVAVHSACKAILANECTSALAGGVNIMTSPEWFQNLASASFLSPTGQCKPFDSKADGYCRAEGVGAVFLKNLSAAINDGDQILGVIRGSAVYQNANCTGITVPNSPSLSTLFTDVIQQAGLCPEQISVVEAHAAGTAVGDPVEYNSIRKVCGGVNRTERLFVGSAKGVIGHAECASGIIALVKTLMMIQRQTIPPQASLQELNPALQYSPTDNIEIATNLQPWRSDFRAAMINNFGASGSNACLVVTEGPRWCPRPRRGSASLTKPTRYPFMFCGLNERSLRAYSSRLLTALETDTLSSVPRTISNLSFQVSRQSNRTLGNALVFACSSVSELEQKLRSIEESKESVATVVRGPPKPVIMCFGGQVSTSIGLSRHIYEGVTILRKNLDECDRICRAIGLDGLYPHIFHQSPVDDVVLLQTALFSIQYACAKSWMDCGVEVAAVVGLSFGELTALCISGALSLQEAIRLVSCRAKIIQDGWGPEKGSMMAIDGSIQDVQRLVTKCNKICQEDAPVCIACFNGPRNFTLAGSSRGIDNALHLAESDASFSSLRYKKLRVSHAFHSALADLILVELEKLGSQFAFKTPKIHFERATEVGLERSTSLSSSFVAEHMRHSSFYNNAVQRLANQYPSAIWLEAGTSSSITALTSRALGSPQDSSFQAVNISSENAMLSLADATMTLWREGINCSFWPHHESQATDYCPMSLPPYQFENHKHWMELKKPMQLQGQSADEAGRPTEHMWTFVGYGNSDKRTVQFRINTTSKKYLDHVLGHKVAQSAPICSSTVQLEIAMDALMSLRPEFTKMMYKPELRVMENLSPMVLDHTRQFWLNARAIDDKALAWHWEIVSTKENSTVSAYVSGEIVFRSVNDPHVRADFAKYERIVSHGRCTQLLGSTDVDEVMQGQGIYRAFTDILVYGDMYKGLRKIVGKGFESAGKVTKAWDGDTWINSGLLDSFCQVAGMYVNNMTDREDDEMYISNGIDQFIRSPHYYDKDMRSDTWDVYSTNYRSSAKEFLSDVFIFDARTGTLAEIIVGIKYVKVSRTGLGKMVSRLTPGVDVKGSPVVDANITRLRDGSTKTHLTNEPTLLPQPTLVAPMVTDSERTRAPLHASNDQEPKIFNKLCNILVNLSGLDDDVIRHDSILEEIGFDSLMGMELARELETTFHCAFSVDLLLDLTTVAKVVSHLSQRTALANVVV